jgi:hypothetical protein
VFGSSYTMLFNVSGFPPEFLAESFQPVLEEMHLQH